MSKQTVVEYWIWSHDMTDLDAAAYETAMRDLDARYDHLVFERIDGEAGRSSQDADLVLGYVPGGGSGYVEDPACPGMFIWRAWDATEDFAARDDTAWYKTAGAPYGERPHYDDDGQITMADELDAYVQAIGGWDVIA